MKKRKVKRSTEGEPRVGRLLKAYLMENHAPPAVVTDGTGNVLYANKRIGKYMAALPGCPGVQKFLKMPDQRLKIPATSLQKFFEVVKRRMVHMRQAT